MDFTDSQIARLVLGYLKGHNMSNAYGEFMKSCKHFKRHEKYFATRVNGMSLVEILRDYAELCNIVQGRLEATSFYSEGTSKGSLVEQLLFLLDKIQYSRAPTPSSTPHRRPSRGSSDVETTPIHTLPGNICGGSEQSYFHKHKAKNSAKNFSKSLHVALPESEGLSEVLTQTLLENRELHEKLAETINIVRNSPEINHREELARTSELNATIKTVVQRTEQEPIFDRILEDIIGGISGELPVSNSNVSCQTSNPNFMSEVYCNQQMGQQSQLQNNEVFVYDGSIESYLKNSVPAPSKPNNNLLMVQPNVPLYFLQNPSMPQTQTVNNNITEQDILAMPTVIVNEKIPIIIQPGKPKKVRTNKNKKKSLRPLMPQKIRVEITKPLEYASPQKVPIQNDAPKTPPPSCSGVQKKETPKTNSHIRNLDFSTPPKLTSTAIKKTETLDKNSPNFIHKKQAAKSLFFKDKDKTKDPKTSWDADLRVLIGPNLGDSRATPKRNKKSLNRKKAVLEEEAKKLEEALKTPVKTAIEEVPVEETPKEESLVTPVNENEAEKHPILSNKNLTPMLMTPLKEDFIPKTPGVELEETPFNQSAVTPFTRAINENLQGLDINSIETPNVPITPGLTSFTPHTGLTPPEQRRTDYSTSSSYYQPSDGEHNKSLDVMIEECKRLEEEEKNKKKTGIKILSNVVIAESTVKNNFNRSIIGKKNLNLMKESSVVSSDSSSCSLSSTDIEDSTVILCETPEVAPVKPYSLRNKSKDKDEKTVSCLDKRRQSSKLDYNKELVLQEVEAKRQRTISKLEQPELSLRSNGRVKKPVNKAKEPPKRTRKKPVKSPPLPTRPKSTRKAAQRALSPVKPANPVPVQQVDNPVDFFKERGINLIQKEKVVQQEPAKNIKLFDTKVFEQEDFVFNFADSPKVQKKFSDYDLNLLEKRMDANVYLEELDMEKNVEIKWSQFNWILELTPTRKSGKYREEPKGDEDSLMTFAVLGKTPSKEGEVSPASKTRKKRKASDQDSSNIGKKAKCEVELLKQVNVDEILDKIHKESDK